MDLKLIRNLVRIMERGEVGELEIEDEKAGLRILLRRGREVQGQTGGPVVNLMGGAAPMQDLQGTGFREREEFEDEEAPRADLEEITSPMVGTFYRGSSPEADVFAEVGQSIEDETVVCIIEAMKVMNEIKAECTGQVIDVLVENGEPVEFGQPLFLVKTR